MCVPRAEVLPVQQRVGEEPARGGHEVIHEGVVPLAPDARMPFAEVDLAAEQAEVVGADVEHDRDAAAGVDAGGRGVEAQLADGDLDPADPLVADAQDPLGVGHHQQVDVVALEAVVEQGLLDVLRAVDGEEDAARPVVLVAEPLDGLPDRRCVDDRQHLLEMVRQQSVEQHLVAIPEVGEVEVLAEGGRRTAVLVVHAPALRLEAGHSAGHQPDQPERPPLGVGECRTPVGHRVGQHRPAAGADAQRPASHARLLLVVPLHHGDHPVVAAPPGQARVSTSSPPRTRIGRDRRLEG